MKDGRWYGDMTDAVKRRERALKQVAIWVAKAKEAEAEIQELTEEMVFEPNPLLEGVGFTTANENLVTTQEN